MNNSITRGSWLHESKLIPALLIFGHMLNYEFDDTEFDEIKYGLSGTSFDKNKFFEYTIKSEKQMNFSFCRDDDNYDLIGFRVEFDSSLTPEVEIALFVLDNFSIQHFGYRNDMPGIR